MNAKTRALLNTSVERVIFLDEAYSLTTYDNKQAAVTLMLVQRGTPARSGAPALGW